VGAVRRVALSETGNRPVDHTGRFSSTSQDGPQDVGLFYVSRFVLTMLGTSRYGDRDMATKPTETSKRAYGRGRNRFLQIRVSDDEHAQLHNEAKRRGFATASDFLRAVGLDATPEAAAARKRELKALDKLEADTQALAASIRSRHNIGGGK
jgi:hypothetical protein